MLPEVRFVQLRVAYSVPERCTDSFLSPPPQTSKHIRFLQFKARQRGVSHVAAQVFEDGESGRLDRNFDEVQSAIIASTLISA